MILINLFWSIVNLQVDAHSNLGNLMKAQGLMQEVSSSKWKVALLFLENDLSVITLVNQSGG